ncbi:hypothetical protein SAMN04489859_101758 [Paracoccus alcaliphilus]|uniref:Uncharacterized protein n=1 Tax=Paracoccus alcaliphilus TaxID=34002 RepID=A0A1H8JID2_9RHOB|nr:hypothetical protein SAMN04489859_101758 [Paracoccus alcaliphilus]
MPDCDARRCRSRLTINIFVTVLPKLGILNLVNG